MNMPRFQLAHLGSECNDTLAVCTCSITLELVRLFLLQSAQLLLLSNFTKLLSVCWFCAARSAPGLVRDDIAPDDRDAARKM